MDWEEHLITLYLKICKEYQQTLWISCQRFTNGGNRSFSDEEAMLIYLFCTLRGLRTIKSMHAYADDHLLSWFPKLPKYSAFVHRLNQLSEGFRHLIELLQSEKILPDDTGVYLVDSFPITLARHNHAYTAKVASELASKSYNATKKQYYYGVKAHVVARKREGKLPDLEILMVEGAARQDGPMFDQIRPLLSDNLVFADKAYKRTDESAIEKKQHLKVLTPIIKKRGKELSIEEQKYSKAVSRMRQPIEALFGWLNRITGIEDAGLVRSSAGLMTHIFGKIAAAMFKRIYC